MSETNGAILHDLIRSSKPQLDTLVQLTYLHSTTERGQQTSPVLRETVNTLRVTGKPSVTGTQSAPEAQRANAGMWLFTNKALCALKFNFIYFSEVTK